MLELSLAEAPDEQTLADVALAAHALAYVVIANRRFTDLFEWGQRSVPLSLAAEIQHRLLPGSYTCEAGQFTLAAWLEPAGDVGGDTFDFAMERDTLHLSMTDAMGHAVDAVGPRDRARRGAAQRAPRRSRARRAGAPRQRRARRLRSTGRVRDRTGRARRPARPRPRPSSTPAIRRRCDSATAASSRRRCRPTRRSGPSASYEYRVQALPLEPGDRLMFLTDGMLERNAAERRHRGRLVRGGRDMHPREAVQHLVQAGPRGDRRRAQRRRHRHVPRLARRPPRENARPTQAQTTETPPVAAPCRPGRTPCKSKPRVSRRHG